MARAKKAVRSKLEETRELLEEMEFRRAAQPSAPPAAVVCKCGSVNFHIYTDGNLVCAKCNVPMVKL